MSFREVSFGIHRTCVTPKRTSSDDYGTISACDVMTSSPAVWQFGSPNRRCQFLKSKSLLILIVDFRFQKDIWSQPLKLLVYLDCWLQKVLIGRLRSFRIHFHIKGWFDPPSSFSCIFSVQTPEPNRIFSPPSSKIPKKSSNLSTFELLPLRFTSPVAFHQPSWCFPRFSWVLSFANRIHSSMNQR